MNFRANYTKGEIRLSIRSKYLRFQENDGKRKGNIANWIDFFGLDNPIGLNSNARILFVF